MILYHGSNVEVRKPIILNSRKFLDFGPGFYMTSDLDQATRWAFRKTEIAKEGHPTLSVFSVDEVIWKDLKIKTFSAPDEEWLDCITENRKGILPKESFDVISGPVANDQTINTIGIYFRGLITAQMAIELLLPNKLKDQYCFKNDKALKSLVYDRTERLRK